MCLIQHHKVIQTYSQLVNPDSRIPVAIQRLTGIHPQDLVSAPYFDEIAPVLRQMLSETVIVAHNVNFDYPFLNAEFARVGLRTLANDALDTVQLAQILLPNSVSYRLSDLTHLLNIQHNNPHQADSDAVSTAKLLIELSRRFRQLPGPTQQQLARLGQGLLRQTGKYLQYLARDAQPLTGHYLMKRGVVIANPAPERQSRAARAGRGLQEYPAKEAAKRKMIKRAGGQLRFRYAQARMMDRVYANATNDQQPLVIEAGTGLGKSLGYLIPYSFVATPDNKVIIATSTTVLQSQLMNSTIPLVEQLVGHPVDAVTLKSPRHYIDLNKFATTLHDSEVKGISLVLQMQILVWLTSTKTGDLDELHTASTQSAFFVRIQHTGNFGTEYSNPFYKVDFYRNALRRVDAAAIVVTNHAYLAAHYTDDAFSGQPFLVVDEAQHFAENAANAFTVRLNLKKLHYALNQFDRIIGGPDTRGLAAIYADNQIMSYQLRSLQLATDKALNLVAGIQTRLFHHYFAHQQRPHNGFMELNLSHADIQTIIDRFTPVAQDILGLSNQILTIADTLLTDYTQNENHFLTSDIRTFQHLEDVAAGLSEQLGPMTALTEHNPLLTDAQVAVPSLTLRHPDDLTSLNVNWRVFDVRDHLQNLLRNFTAPVFTGGTLTIRKDAQFLTNQLGYPALPDTQVMTLRSPFKYKQQARVMIAADAPHINDLSAKQYADYLTNAIERLADNEHQTLVLFNSLTVIGHVFARLNRRPIADRKEILAQGVTGSAARIARRFAVSRNSVLLGAASFFEGVDYPDKQLETVILTRLPFDMPNDPVIKARYDNIKASGADPFTQDAVPRATLRLRQSFGRLIRRESDRGVFIVLDDRLTRTSYGRGMQKSLPSVTTDLLPLAAMPDALERWLTPDEEEQAAAKKLLEEHKATPNRRPRRRNTKKAAAVTTKADEARKKGADKQSARTPAKTTTRKPRTHKPQSAVKQPQTGRGTKAKPTQATVKSGTAQKQPTTTTKKRRPRRRTTKSATNHKSTPKKVVSSVHKPMRKEFVHAQS
nr:helicase C-terminal domain-containing protein [Lacticaseibacillus thailandensis]